MGTRRFRQRFILKGQEAEGSDRLIIIWRIFGLKIVPRVRLS